MIDHYYLIFTHWAGAALLVGFLIIGIEWVWSKVFDRILLFFGVKLHFLFYVRNRKQIENAINADTKLIEQWYAWSRKWHELHG